MTHLEGEDHIHSHFQGDLGWAGHTFVEAAEHGAAGFIARRRLQCSVNLRTAMALIVSV